MVRKGSSVRVRQRALPAIRGVLKAGMRADRGVCESISRPKSVRSEGVGGTGIGRNLRGSRGWLSLPSGVYARARSVRAILACARDRGWRRAAGSRCRTFVTSVLHFGSVPTTRPRYTVTDTGHLAELLDAAARRWPDVVDRKQLLLRLAEEGHHALASAELAAVAGDRRGRVGLALERIPSLVDVDRLLSDEAWS